MEFRNVLVLCTGNICRSPMAKLLLEHSLKDKGISGINVSSAGVAAIIGHAASEHAQTLMRERGLDISRHRAVQVVPEALIQADLVLVMENEQQQAIERMQPAVKGRAFMLGEWGGFEIPDPYRQEIDVYRRVLGMIDRGVEEWIGKAW
jgi:protein-tyrosine phosphatase